MIEWVNVNSKIITRIGYNKMIGTLYIDFSGSTSDTPYKDVSEEIFTEFTKSENVDNYYITFIKDTFEPSHLNSESIIRYE